MKVEWYLSNYAAEADLKEVTSNDTSKLVSKTDLAGLTINVGKLDVDKLSTVPADLRKLSNVVDNMLSENCI